MKTYESRDTRVFVRDTSVAWPFWGAMSELELPLRRDLVDHSPTGFAWGYCGSGPAQLALAMLADLFDDEFALMWYQSFKQHVIGVLFQGSASPWVLGETDLRRWRREAIEQQGHYEFGTTTRLHYALEHSGLSLAQFLKRLAEADAQAADVTGGLAERLPPTHDSEARRRANEQRRLSFACEVLPRCMSGRSIPPVPTADIYAQMLGVSTQWLLTGESCRAVQRTLAEFDAVLARAKIPQEDRVKLRELVACLRGGDEP